MQHFRFEEGIRNWAPLWISKTKILFISYFRKTVSNFFITDVASLVMNSSCIQYMATDSIYFL